MKIGIIIQGRLASTRLRDKILLPFHGKESLIQILIHRLQKNKYDIPVVLATTTNPYDDQLVEAVGDITVYRGSELDVLDRFIKTMEKMQFTHAIRVCSDNPFLSLKYIENLIEMCQRNYDYIGYSIEDGLPSIRSHIGYFAECVSYKALQRTIKETDAKFDHEHVTYYIHSHPEKFNNLLVDYRMDDVNLSNIRLTLDTREDFYILSQMYATLVKNKKELCLENIIELILEEPEYGRVMKKMIFVFQK